MTIALPARQLTSRRTRVEVVEVALVNLMPDAAFEESERQFCGLVHAAAGRLPVRISHYAMTETARREDVAAIVARRYRDIAALEGHPPNALVVTGTEPRCATLPEEGIYQRLSSLLRWAERRGVSIFSSCLSSHAALLALDGIERRPLAAKLSGVFPQWVRPGDPITKDVFDVSCPHSRLNEVPVQTLERRGYRVLVGSREVGWSVATRERAGITLLMQGHPEYDDATLLREYRRDVRRFLEKAAPAYPATPVGYLDQDGVGLLELFKLAATADGVGPAIMERFPFHLCAEHICADWRGPMERLVGNWLREVARRADGLRSF